MSDAPAQAVRPAGSGPATASPAADLLALADRCVQCGLCLPHCPTYGLDRLESESPRGRIAWVRAVANGRLHATEAGDSHLDHCLGCRRCEPVCPAGVRYGELLVLARTAQAGRRPQPAGQRRLLALLRRPRLLAALLEMYRRLFALLPAAWRPLPRPPAYPPRSGGPTPPGQSVPTARTTSAIPAAPTGSVAPQRTAIFVGCIARHYEAGTRAALLRLLAAAGQDATQPAGQGCCGAAAAHAGQAADAAALAADNRAALAGHGQVLCLASGCHDTLAGSLAGQARVDDPLAWLDRHGERLVFRRAGRRVALHLPCTQRSVVGSDGALGRLLSRVPDLEVIVLPDTGCCGAAGLHHVAEPARAAALRQPLLAALAASGAGELLSANIGCRLHLGNGTTLPVRHPIDFLAEHLA